MDDKVQNVSVEYYPSRFHCIGEKSKMTVAFLRIDLALQHLGLQHDKIILLKLRGSP